MSEKLPFSDLSYRQRRTNRSPKMSPQTPWVRRNTYPFSTLNEADVKERQIESGKLVGLNPASVKRRNEIRREAINTSREGITFF